jgi:hypothetical protein
MRRAARSIATLATLLAPMAIAHGAPVHRLHSITPPLPRSLSVDETEYMITTSHDVVAAGAVKITAYNRGMDAHDLVIKGPGGIRGMIQPYLPGTSQTITVHLKRGTYLFYCSMFAGTPQSHEALGMHTLVQAR